MNNLRNFASYLADAIEAFPTIDSIMPGAPPLLRMTSVWVDNNPTRLTVTTDQGTTIYIQLTEV